MNCMKIDEEKLMRIHDTLLQKLFLCLVMIHSKLKWHDANKLSYNSINFNSDV